VRERVALQLLLRHESETVAVLVELERSFELHRGRARRHGATLFPGVLVGARRLPVRPPRRRVVGAPGRAEALLQAGAAALHLVVAEQGRGVDEPAGRAEECVDRAVLLQAAAFERDGERATGHRVERVLHEHAVADLVARVGRHVGRGVQFACLAPRVAEQPRPVAGGARAEQRKVPALVHVVIAEAASNDG
jgi:hypothetical protein